MVRGPALDAIVKVRAWEVPPPGAGLLTATLAEPGEAIVLAEIEAVSRVLLMKIVGRFEPCHVTTELAVKFEPVTVRVKLTPPAVTESGLIPVRTGTGLLIRKVKSLVPEPAVG